MPPSSSPPTATGLIWAATIFVGAGIGITKGQPSAGLLGGVIVGGVIALALWWRDRRRS